MDSRRLGQISALSLTVLTLAVFGASRNTGAESQVRGFIEAAFRGEGQDAERYLTNLYDPGSAQTLYGQIQQLFGTRATIRKIDYIGSRAEVLVSFDMPMGGTYHQIFVLKRTNRGWRIDPHDTVHFIDGQL
ncbi:MAG: hypothetical protein JNJ45_08900 [Chthonomonas sp.]|nr:hypothetical protein [Chthonomonas sp.]